MQMGGCDADSEDGEVLQQGERAGGAACGDEGEEEGAGADAAQGPDEQAGEVGAFEGEEGVGEQRGSGTGDRGLGGVARGMTWWACKLAVPSPIPGPRPPIPCSSPVRRTIGRYGSDLRRRRPSHHIR